MLIWAYIIIIFSPCIAITIIEKLQQQQKNLTWIRIFIMKGLLNPVPLMVADPDTKKKHEIKLCLIRQKKLNFFKEIIFFFLSFFRPLDPVP